MNVIKTDPLGEVEWWKTFGGSSWDNGQSIHQTTDGGYIIAVRRRLTALAVLSI